MHTPGSAVSVSTQQSRRADVTSHTHRADRVSHDHDHDHDRDHEWSAGHKRTPASKPQASLRKSGVGAVGCVFIALAVSSPALCPSLIAHSHSLTNHGDVVRQ